MNKILIVDASASDGRIMAAVFTRAGYNPVVTDCIEAGKVEAANLPPGAVIRSRWHTKSTSIARGSRNLTFRFCDPRLLWEGAGKTP